jgi:hypothetical protein
MKLTDNPVLPGTDKLGRPNMDEKYNKKLPEVLNVMRKLRSTANEYGSVLIGETWTSNVAELKDYYGPQNDGLQLPMDLMMTNFTGFPRINTASTLPPWTPREAGPPTSSPITTSFVPTLATATGRTTTTLPK